MAFGTGEGAITFGIGVALGHFIASNLAIAFCAAALQPLVGLGCASERRQRFTSGADNERIRDHYEGRSAYVSLAEVAAELLFQIIAEKAEKGCCHRDHQLALLGMAPVFTKPDSSRRCSIGSPIRHTSSRPVRSRTASAELYGRIRKSNHGVFGSASTPRLGLRQQNRAPSTSMSQGVGQHKPAEECQTKSPNSKATYFERRSTLSTQPKQENSPYCRTK